MCKSILESHNASLAKPYVLLPNIQNYGEKKLRFFLRMVGKYGQYIHCFESGFIICIISINLDYSAWADQFYRGSDEIFSSNIQDLVFCLSLKAAGFII